MRVHKYRHPVLGVASWIEIRALADGIRKAGKRLCSWCHGPVPAGRITRCSAACGDAIALASQPGMGAKMSLRRDKYTCQICGKRGECEADHVIPVSLGGTSDMDNLRALCHECHVQESARLRRMGSSYFATIIKSMADAASDPYGL